MAKRKITVTVDEELVAALERLGSENVSATVNAALAAQVETLGRQHALRELLDHWNSTFGEPTDRARRAASAAFAELDGVDSSRVA